MTIEPLAFFVGGDAVTRRLARGKILRVDDDCRISIFRLASDIENLVI